MNWITFFTVLGIIFLGELGDKTQLIVFNISLQHEKSYKVAIGAMIGFALIVSLAILLGNIIQMFIPLSFITLISGFVFIIIGIIELRPLKRLYKEYYKQEGLTTELIEEKIADPKDPKDPNDNQNIQTSRSLRDMVRNNPYLAGLFFILLMELGDKTQILTITLASIYPYPLEVWLGAFLALSSLAWMGAYLGELIARKIPKFHLKAISIGIFLFIGITIIFTSI